MLSFKIILVEPEHPHNVGFVARAMRANDLHTLSIVYHSKKNVLKSSYRTAHNAAEILDQAKIEKSLADALNDCNYSIAFSRRVFNSILPHIFLNEIAGTLKNTTSPDLKVALVFGRESKGLFLNEINLCAAVCEIPVPGLMSLNLAQAVSVVAYELTRSGFLSNTGKAYREIKGDPSVTLANIGQIETFKSFLLKNLTGRYQNLPWTEAFIQQFLQKAKPTINELGALYGITRSLSKEYARAEKEEQK